MILEQLIFLHVFVCHKTFANRYLKFDLVILLAEKYFRNKRIKETEQYL